MLEARKRSADPGSRVPGQTGCLDLFPELTDRLRVRVGDPPGGEQQMLAVGRSLGRDPKVLLGRTGPGGPRQ